MADASTPRSWHEATSYSSCSLCGAARHREHGHGQTASRPARVGMLCATVCPTVVLDELRRLGWIEGSTILIDRKPAASRLERLPQLAKELVQSKPDLIIATTSQPVRAAKDATTEIPIVMLYVADPVGVGLAQSLHIPGGT